MAHRHHAAEDGDGDGDGMPGGDGEEVVQGEEDEEEDVLSAWTADTSMLADHDRNAKYEAALRRLAPGKRVLDIGTGTGLLAMLAARHNASSVVACEVYQPMAQIARETLKRNGFEQSVELVAKESTEITLDGDLNGRPVGLIVSEIVDSELLGEGILPSIRDAVRRLGSGSCVCIPNRATVHCQLVQSNLLRSWVDLNACRIAGIPVFGDKAQEWVKPALKHEVHVGQLAPELERISEPFQAATVDLARIADEDDVTTSVASVAVPRGARVDGVVMWWAMVLADDIAIDTRPPWLFASPRREQASRPEAGRGRQEKTRAEEEKEGAGREQQQLTEMVGEREQRPGPQRRGSSEGRGDKCKDSAHVWREHWLPMVYVFESPITTAATDMGAGQHRKSTANSSICRAEKSCPYPAQEGPPPQEQGSDTGRVDRPDSSSKESLVHVAMSHDDYSIEFAASLDPSSRALRRTRLSTASPILPRDRIAMLNSTARMSQIDAAVRSLAQEMTCSRIVGFGSINVAAVAACRAFPSAQVHAVEHKHTAPVLKEMAAREGVSLIVHTEAAALDDAPIDLVVAEPFYLDATEPWQAGIRFAHGLARLRARGSPPTAVFPVRVALCCALVQFKHLHTIRHRVQQACGFDMSAFDEAVCRPGTFSSVQSLWEYEHTLLSEPEEAIQLDFARIAAGQVDVSEAASVDVPLRLTRTGTCHAIAVFTRTYLTQEVWEDGFARGGGYSPFKQGVFLLDSSQPCTGERGDVITARVSLQPREHSASVKADILRDSAA